MPIEREEFLGCAPTGKYLPLLPGKPGKTARPVSFQKN